MREIKFRAWDTSQNKMYSWEFIGESDNNSNLSLWNLLNNLIDDCKNSIKPMQFTGLKDKNGKEIYDGDILNTKSDKNIVVCWVDRFSSFCLEKKFCLEKNGGTHRHFFGESVEAIDCEIIGNIYENPDLLTEKGLLK